MMGLPTVINQQLDSFNGTDDGGSWTIDNNTENTVVCTYVSVIIGVLFYMVVVATCCVAD